MKRKRSYYDILGVERAATRDEIRRAYRAAARQLHPDANPSSDAEAKFKEIAEAYATLNDPDKRSEYDDRLAGITERPISDEPHFTWSNIAARGASVTMAEEERRERRTELDEMYDAFFGKKTPGARRKKKSG